jgi:hypothetical protein
MINSQKELDRFFHIRGVSHTPKERKEMLKSVDMIGRVIQMMYLNMKYYEYCCDGFMMRYAIPRPGRMRYALLLLSGSQGSLLLSRGQESLPD